MTFWGNIVYLCSCSVICANDTTRAQINNIPSKSHVIPLLLKTVFIFDIMCNIQWIDINYLFAFSLAKSLTISKTILSALPSGSCYNNHLVRVTLNLSSFLFRFFASDLVPVPISLNSIAACRNARSIKVSLFPRLMPLNYSLNPNPKPKPNQGRVARSMVSANHWFRSMKTCTFQNGS